MIYKLITLLVLVTITLSGCATQSSVPKAGLIPLAGAESEKWDLPHQLAQQGEGNSSQVLGRKDPKENILELAAGSQGNMEYFLERQADITTVGALKVQFLSTQGLGRIKLSAIDGQGKIVGETGFVFTGKVPQNSSQSLWHDVRYKTNYQGDWIEQTYNFMEVFASLPQDALVGAVRYRLSVEVGQGQHVLVTKFSLGSDITKAVSIVPSSLRYNANQGDVLTIDADVQNLSKQPIDHTLIKLVEPYGHGLVVANLVGSKIDQLGPEEKRRISFKVRAQRPDAVNLNKPWTLKFSVNEQEVETQVQVAVADKRPGKVFYVMTEDLEPIDGAGYPTGWGNRNSWLEPEEYLGQIVHKSEALNKIADKYGAKWTHYIAWPAVKAAQWAGKQSQTGQWPKVVAAIEGSVAQEANRGHEYGIHFHSDYDPYLPGNVLSYNEKVDGLWANHLKHGWAHSVLAEGNFNDYASRAGILYDYQRILDKLVSGSGQGQMLTARAGSFDFGNGSADEAISTRVYKKVGLWGSSDADGNMGTAVAAGEFGKEIYFAAADDINLPTQDFANLGIIEFRPTPKQPIAYDSQSIGIMNGKTDQGMQFFTVGNQGVKPGVHAIIGFTHAMFVMGQGDWRSTTGGQFQALDDHLGYVKKEYVDKGLLQFATASQLVEKYLDYYTPQLLGIYGKTLSDGQGVAEYEIKILGSDILVDGDHVHQVFVKYPLYLRESAYRISILKNGQPIYSTWGLPTPYNDIAFIVNDRDAVYTMKIYHNDLMSAAMVQLHKWKRKIF